MRTLTDQKIKTPSLQRKQTLLSHLHVLLHKIVCATAIPFPYLLYMQTVYRDYADVYYTVAQVFRQFPAVYFSKTNTTLSISDVASQAYLLNSTNLSHFPKLL